MWRSSLFSVAHAIIRRPGFSSARKMCSSVKVPDYVYPESADDFRRSYEASRKAKYCLEAQDISGAEQSIKIAIRSAALISGDTPAVASYVRYLRNFQRSIQNPESDDQFNVWNTH